MSVKGNGKGKPGKPGGKHAGKDGGKGEEKTMDQKIAAMKAQLTKNTTKLAAHAYQNKNSIKPAVLK